MSTVPPPDDVAHQDGVLMAEVTSLNTQLGRNVLRFLDADAGQGPELPPAQERELADRLAAVAATVHQRVARREQRGDRWPLLDRAISGQSS